jgi:hypothetical protein
VSNWLITKKAEEVTSQRREEAPICLPRAVRKSYGVSSVPLHQPVGFTPSQSRNKFLTTKHNHGQSINKNSFAQDATRLSLTEESKQSECACHYCCGLILLMKYSKHIGSDDATTTCKQRGRAWYPTYKQTDADHDLDVSLMLIMMLMWAWCWSWCWCELDADHDADVSLMLIMTPHH